MYMMWSFGGYGLDDIVVLQVGNQRAFCRRFHRVKQPDGIFLRRAGAIQKGCSILAPLEGQLFGFVEAEAFHGAGT